MHFATADADSFDDDGVVWCINFIDAQFALFSLMSDPGASLDDWIAAHPRLCRRITVPAELKGELFPDLDGLSRWLERYYRPRQLISSR